MAESLGDALAKDSSDEEEEDAHQEAPPKQDRPPASGSIVDVKQLEEAEFQYERLAGLVHFLQEDNVRLTQEQALMAGEFLRLSAIVTDRSGSGKKSGDQGPMAMVKKAGWVMKRCDFSHVVSLTLLSFLSRFSLFCSAQQESARRRWQVQVEASLFRARRPAAAVL